MGGEQNEEFIIHQLSHCHQRAWMVVNHQASLLMRFAQLTASYVYTAIETGKDCFVERRQS
jgi:hypothetical protein